MYVGFCKCALKKVGFCICPFSFRICMLLGKLITFINVNIWKHAYSKSSLCKCASWKLDFINGHLRKLDYVYPHIWNPNSINAHVWKHTYREASFCKCAFMEIGFSNCTYAEATFSKCAFMEVEFHKCPFMEVDFLYVRTYKS